VSRKTGYGDGARQLTVQYRFRTVDEAGIAIYTFRLVHLDHVQGPRRTLVHWVRVHHNPLVRIPLSRHIRLVHHHVLRNPHRTLLVHPQTLPYLPQTHLVHLDHRRSRLGRLGRVCNYLHFRRIQAEDHGTLWVRANDDDILLVRHRGVGTESASKWAIDVDGREKESA